MVVQSSTTLAQHCTTIEWTSLVFKHVWMISTQQTVAGLIKHVSFNEGRIFLINCHLSREVVLAGLAGRSAVQCGHSFPCSQSLSLIPMTPGDQARVLGHRVHRRRSHAIWWSFLIMVQRRLNVYDTGPMFNQRVSSLFSFNIWNSYQLHPDVNIDLINFLFCFRSIRVICMPIFFKCLENLILLLYLRTWQVTL